LGFDGGGSGKIARNTLPGPDPYNEIMDQSSVISDDGILTGLKREFKGEAVPRFSKRCGSTVIQGSNDSRVVCGTHRGYNVEGKGGELDGGELGMKDDSGSVDIVAGTGQSLTTSAKSYVTNTRGFQEVDPASESQNINESDPDFINDSSRVYVTKRASGDIDFGLIELEPLKAEDVTGDDPELEEDFLVGDVDGAFATLASTNTRIIAKEDGGIKIIKKGANGENLAAILMQPDGKIQINANTILIGKGDDTCQPYIRYDEFEKLMTSVVEHFNHMTSVIKAEVTAEGLAWDALAAGFGPPFSTIPVTGPMIAAGPLAAAASAGSTANAALLGWMSIWSDQIEKINEEIEPVRSKIIFGE